MDGGTRAEPRSFAETIAELMAVIGADGVNGDTFVGLPRTFRTASDATGHSLVFEPEGYALERHHPAGRGSHPERGQDRAALRRIAHTHGSVRHFRQPVAKRPHVVTIVNRTAYKVDGPQLTLPAQAGMHCFDLWHGLELKAAVSGGTATPSFAMESSDYGAVLVQPEAADLALNTFPG